MNDLCVACNVATRVTKHSTTPQLLDAAEDARSGAIDAYHSFLGKHFGHLKNTNPLYDVLMRINFKGYLTLNFDPLLAYEARKPEHKCSVAAYPDCDREALKNRTLFYIHGLIDEGKVPTVGSIVLSRSEFEKAYAHDSMLRAFLIQTFTKDPICFVGCRLSEPQLEFLFKLCVEIQKTIVEVHGGTPPSKYIVLPDVAPIYVKNPDGTESRDPKSESDLDENEVKLYASMGIKVVRFEPIDQDYTGLRKAFEPLSTLLPVPNISGFGGRGPHV